MKKGILFLLSLIFIISCKTSPNDGVSVKTKKGTVLLTAYNDNVIRVRYADGRFSDRESLVVMDTARQKTEWTKEENSEEVVLSTKKVKAHINKKTGNIIFTDVAGNVILKEAGKNIKDTIVLDEECKNIEVSFDWQAGEGIYGLGQFQDGAMNYRGKIRRLVQHNTIDVVPVLTSTKGYGIFWDNYSYTEFRDSGYKEGGNSIGSLYSEVADEVDYYFIYGPELDNVVASYRNLSGNAPMYGRWAYGLWQCKEHYHTQQEILDVAAEYRKRNIPVDNIVQDWFYWNPKPWGSHTFDRSRYPDPDALTRELHEKYHMQIMISVWAKFEMGSANYDEMNKAKFLYPKTYGFDSSQYYDVYNPAARKMYWKQMNDSIFKRGFDAWWLDATEPEMGDLTNDNIKSAMDNHLGSGARYLNSYSLMTSKAVYEGQREVTDKKRVFILTRSNFAGQQRNAAASWSGDITASWEVFHNQVSGGLNMGLSGLPYWTTDIGAFFVHDFPGGNQNKEYQELFLRWFQFGAFCPIFRVHGSSTPREMYEFGDKGYWAYDAQLKIDELRYRLMPYIYSLGWKVHKEGHTIMRGLAFDFRNDIKTRNIGDQFMFGPSILVNPVTEVMYHKDFKNIQSVSEIIPAENLLAEDGTTPGLTGTYFNDEKFEKKISTKISPSINYNFEFGAPESNINTDHYSIRWKGQVVADESGEYVFVTAADDGVRLFVDNKIIIDNWEQQSVTYKKATINLEAGKKYNIQLDYYDVIGGASVRLAWIKPGRMKELDKIEKEFVGKKTKTRPVYLPECAGWYDFWTGKKLAAGQIIDAPAPIDIIPLYVKAGSIIPMGPIMNYTTEKPVDPIEIRIYPGANAEYIIYEDENDNYNYEKGSYAIIPLKWDDASATLTIEARKGNFPGMMTDRTFHIVLVGEKKGMGITSSTPTEIIRYNGNEAKVILNN